MKKQMQQLASWLVFSLVVMVPVGCAGPAKSVTTTQKSIVPKTSAMTEDAARIEQKIEASPPLLDGKVVETMNAGVYTYIQLEKRGKRIWVAVPAMKVSEREIIELRPGMTMENFTSKALNRTFGIIIFSEGPVKEKVN